MPTPLLDIAKLSKRISIIAKTYNPEVKVNGAEPGIEDPLFNSLRLILQGMILNNVTAQEAYWSEAGIRMESTEAFQGCLEKIKMNTKVLGEGYFGKVFNVPVDECMKHIPAGVKRIGVKVEKLKIPFEPSQTPKRVKEVIEITKKANTLNVGPTLYDVFVIVNAAGYIQIIKCFEIIDGKSWRDTEWTPAKKTAALKKLDAHVHTLNKAGIIHHDLHDGNVMVSQTGEVYIIDYDLARFVDFEEENIVARFNDSENQWEPKGAASRMGTYYVFTKLVEEGSIVLPSSAAANANKANGNNNSGQGKRGTAKAKKNKKGKNA